MPKIRKVADFSYFICQEVTVFGQYGWDVRNVAHLVVKCCSMKRILRRVCIPETVNIW